MSPILNHIVKLLQDDGFSPELLEDNTFEVVMDDHIAQVQIAWEDVVA